VQGDPEMNRRTEADLAPKLPHQGLEAVPSGKLFPSDHNYSPRELMNRMRRAGIDGVMKAAPGQGLKYYSLKDQTATLSDRSSPYDSAMAALLSELAR